MQRKPASPLQLHYRSWGQGGVTHHRHKPAAVSTSLYRDVIGKSLYSECKMLPHDSEYFDRLAKRCGGLRAVFRSAARLLLERGASTEYLTPVRLEGKLKWIDFAEDAPCE